VVQWLLDHGADPNRVGFNTVRPIHHAAMHGST
jgi:ankyrin repeat protein